MEQSTERFDVALIGAPHGVRGEVRIKELSDIPDRMKRLKQAYLISVDRTVERIIQLSARKGTNGWLVSIEGVDSREEAEKLRGCYLSISRNQAEPLPKGRFFVRDLIGLTIIDEKLGKVGQLKDILKDSVQDVYVVSREGRNDFLFPGVPQFLTAIEPENGRILVALPDGLMDIYD
ncbi:MAG: ribosome maturation factor RimM [Fastidiosipilaceae bacterium]